MKQLLKNAALSAGSAYWRIRAVPWVWESLLNRRARQLFRAYPAALGSAEAKIVAALNETGIAVSHVSDLFPAGAFAELERYAQGRWKTPEVQVAVRDQAVMTPGEKAAGVKKYFLVNLWEGKRVLDMNQPFIRFSVSGPILRVVNAYLGMFSKFRDWRLEATIPVPPGARSYASQRWHRDPEDQKLVKVFLYLNDVDETAGPFTYLKHSHAGGKWRGLFSQRPPSGSPKMPANEDAFIPSEDILVAAGRAGTMIFCDTSGLHKGGLARERHRLMYTSIHTSSASPWPIRYTYPPDFRPPTDLLPAARFAIENDPRQREPRFYR